MFHLLSSRFKSGFTIVEFLVVFGIIGLITTLSIASYNTFTESFKLKNEVQNMIAVFSLAQKRAIAGEDVTAYCGSTCSFDSFVVVYTGSGGYTMQGRYDTNAPVGTKVSYGTPITYSIDSVNRNVAILDTGSAVFTKLTGALDASKIIRFKNTSKNECIRIDISATVLISSTTITCPESP